MEHTMTSIGVENIIPCLKLEKGLVEVKTYLKAFNESNCQLPIGAFKIINSCHVHQGGVLPFKQNFSKELSVNVALKTGGVSVFTHERLQTYRME